MNSKQFKIANLVWQFNSISEIKDCKMFKNFRTESERADIVFNISEENLPPKTHKCVSKSKGKEKYINGSNIMYYSSYSTFDDNIDYACLEIYEDEKTELYICTDNEFHDQMVFDAICFPEYIIRKNMYLFHCSFIIADGKAILFSGDSGKGKSTQADLWNKYRNAEIINGDRAILKIENGKLIAYGTPYCGSSKYSVNKFAEVAAIIFPEHSKENSIIEIDSSFSAIPALLGQLTIDDQINIEKALTFAAEIFKSIPMFTLFCVPNETAVETAENELKALGII